MNKMKRGYLLIIGLGAIFFSCNPTKNLSDSELSLIGTKWSYEDNRHDWKYDISFFEGGRMETTHPNDNTPKNDSWQQDGAILKFSFNNQFSVYQGKRKSFDQIGGTAKNVNGKKWKWTLTKKDNTLDIGTEINFYEDIHFEFSKGTLKKELSKKSLDSITNIVSQNPKNHFEVQVHTGTRGTDSYNLELSEKRAEALSAYFSTQSTIFSRMRFKGYGESNPILTKGDLDELYDIHGNRIDKDDPRSNQRVVLIVTK